MINNLILTLSIFIGQIFFVLISLFGISYTGSSESPLLIIAVSTINIYSIVYVIIYEVINFKKGNGSLFPYAIPFIVYIFFITEYAFGNVSLNNYEGQRFLFFSAYCIAPIFVANYCLRYDKFNMISKSLDIIMLVSTIALIANVPKMSVEAVIIGGGGGRQDTSYIAAFSLGINLSNLLLGHNFERYAIFRTKGFKFFSIFLIPAQILITIMGRGRGGAVLLIVSVFLILILNFKASLKRTLFFATLLCIILYIFVTNINSQLLNDLLSVGLYKSFSYFNGTTVDLFETGRDWVYKAIIDLIKERPSFGYGFFNAYSASYAKIGGYPHNVFLDILLQGGILYFIIFITFIKKTYSNLFKIINKDQTKALLLPIALFPSIMLLFSGTYLNNASFWFFLVYSFFYFSKKRIEIAKSKKTKTP